MNCAGRTNHRVLGLDERLSRGFHGQVARSQGKCAVSAHNRGSKGQLMPKLFDYIWHVSEFRTCDIQLSGASIDEKLRLVYI